MHDARGNATGLYPGSYRPPGERGERARPVREAQTGRAVRGVLVLFAAALVAVGLVLVGASVPALASPTNTASDVPEAVAPSAPSGNSEQGATPGPSHLLQKAEREGSVRVIVRLRTDFAPEGRLGRTEVADQRDGIESAQAGLREQLRGTGYQTMREFQTIPYIVLDVSPRALQALQRSSLATDVIEDRLDEASRDESATQDLDSPTLAQSTPLVQAPTMWANGYTGSGKVLAILDTGVDSSHPFLANKVIEEACFTGSGVAGAGSCPNGSSTQVGAGSGVPCTFATFGCQHGTHVAGIAAGRGSSFSGVAKDANIMAVQVFSRFTGAPCANAGESPCALSYTSDQIAGMERVYIRRGAYDFSSVNMSIGGGRNTSTCDSDPRKPIIDNLRSAGIATVISSGNDGYSDATTTPACISSAISVGSTSKSDTLSYYSNSAPWLSLLAPGESIYSSIPGGGFAYFDGTSMAAPHVTGAWALLEQQDPTASVSSILSRLQNTGLSVTDTRVVGGLMKPRIKIADAAGIAPQPPNDNFANARIFSGYSYAASGTNVGATRESGDPAFVGPNNTSHTVWYRWTAPVAETVEIDTCYGLTNFDTILGVYTGSALGSLTEVTSNDDGCDFGRGSKVTLNATQGTTYHILVDGYATQKGDFTLEVVDKTAPTVASTTPANGGRVNPGANIKVTFSEPVMGGGVNPTTFKLKRSGTTTFIGATVSYDPATMRATLNPNNNLQSGRTYVATVTSGVRDEATNFLDQDASVAGNQPKTWKFTVN
jgi:subtilisin